MEFLGGASCHAGRSMELEGGSFSLSGFFRAQIRLCVCGLIKPIRFCRKYFDPNEDGAFDSYGSAGGQYDPYDHIRGKIFKF